MITKESLEMLGEAAEKYGLRTFKHGDMVLVFSPQAPRIVFGDAPSSSRPIGDEFGMPTEDELLYASSPFPMTDDELKARAPR